MRGQKLGLAIAVVAGAGLTVGPNLYCQRIGGGRFAVAFYDDSIVVWRDPDHAQSFRWKR
jgi:hypothetical protein